MKKTVLQFVVIMTLILLLTGCPNVVNYTPKLEIVDQTVTEGQTLTVDLREFTFDRNMEKISGQSWDDKESMTYDVLSGKGEVSNYEYIYSPGYTDEGIYTIKLKVKDTWGSEANDSFELTVIGANATPTIEVPENISTLEGEPYSLDLSLFATDLDMDQITFELLTYEGTLTGSIFTFNPGFDSAGSHPVSIRVTDTASASSTCSFNIEVVNVLRTFDLGVNATPAANGLTVRINDSVYDSPKTISVTEGDVYTLGIDSPQLQDISEAVLGDDVRYCFERWSDGETENERTVIIDSSATYTAEMETEYMVETCASPTDIATISGNGWYEEDSVTNFSAPEVSGYTFDHWEINGMDSGSENPVLITLDSPKKLEAVYSKTGIVSSAVLFGSTRPDRAYSVQQTSDGGYIVAGYCGIGDGDVSGNHGGNDFWIVKLNSERNLEWQKCLGGSLADFALDIKQTSDGGYIVAGYTSSNDGDLSGNQGYGDYWIVKLNGDGSLDWQKCLGGSFDECANDILQTSDGGYIVAGYTSSNDGDLSGNHGGNDYWIVKLNGNGSLDWQKCLGGSFDECANDILQTSDGGYIVAGYTYSNDEPDGDVSGNHGNSDYWVVKLSGDGSLDWQKCLGGSSADFAQDIQQTNDGCYIVAGFTYSNDGDVSGNQGKYDYWVVKLNGDGSLDWQKCLGGSSYDYVYCIQQTDDGGYIAAGYTDSNDGDVSGNHGGNDCWIVKLNGDGSLAWQKCLGGSSADYAYCIQQTDDDGYIAAGYTYSNDGDFSGNKGNSDWFIVKLE